MYFIILFPLRASGNQLMPGLNVISLIISLYLYPCHFILLFERRYFKAMAESSDA